MSAVRSISLLWLASLAAAGLALCTQILLARTVAPADYGLYAASVAVATLLAPLAALGVPGFLLKVFGTEGGAAVRWVRASVLAMLPALLLGMLASAAYACLTRAAGTDRLVGLALVPMVLSFAAAELVMARYQIENRAAWQSFWTLAPNLMRFAVALLGWWLRWPISLVAVGMGLVSLLTGAAALILVGAVRWRHQAASAPPVPGAQASGPNVFGVAKSAMPFGLSLFVFAAYSQGTVLLLESIQGPKAAGTFSLALSILMAVYLVPTVISQRFLLSRFHRWATHDHQRLLQVFRASSGILFALGGALGIGVALLGPAAVHLAFGPSYEDVGALLVMCSLCVPARFLASVVGTSLATKDNIRHRIKAQVGVAITTLLLGSVAIGHWGLVGAAAVATLAEWLLMFAYLRACVHHVFGREALRGWTLNVRDLRGTP